MTLYKPCCLDVQKKLQEEIDLTIEECDGNLPDYNTLQAMPYLEQVVMETLRLHAAAPIITRVCSKDYKFEGTPIELKVNDGVHINVMAIHRDPQHYPEPEKFDPERFSKEGKASRHP